MSILTGSAGRLHNRFVLHRRKRILASYIAPLLPPCANVLDVGAGDGLLAHTIGNLRPDLKITGVDTLVRRNAAIDVHSFDGMTLPFGQGEFDAAMAIDVLHHTADPERLLGEMSRVSGSRIVIKDHLKHGVISLGLLRLMDWVGNAHHGVALPYNYLSLRQWSELWERTGLKVISIDSRLNLYSAPFGWISNWNLHFIAALARERTVAW